MLTERFNICAAWGTTLEATFNVAGCFDVGTVFNVWVNADAATSAYMAPFAVTIDPNAGWCNFNFGGAVDTIVTSITSSSSLTPVSCSSIDLQSTGAYVVSSYTLFESPSCEKSNDGGNINLAAPTACELRSAPLLAASSYWL